MRSRFRILSVWGPLFFEKTVDRQHSNHGSPVAISLLTFLLDFIGLHYPKDAMKRCTKCRGRECMSGQSFCKPLWSKNDSKTQHFLAVTQTRNPEFDYLEEGVWRNLRMDDSTPKKAWDLTANATMTIRPKDFCQGQTYSRFMCFPAFTFVWTHVYNIL